MSPPTQTDYARLFFLRLFVILSTTLRRRLLIDVDLDRVINYLKGGIKMRTCDEEAYQSESIYGRSICPLLSLKGKNYEEEYCRETLCAWWVAEKRCCAMQSMARDAGLFRTGF